MRKFAYALAVAFTTVLGTFGCQNAPGDPLPDGGSGTCTPTVGISVSTESGGFEVFRNGTQVGSSPTSGAINEALCANRSGDTIRVVLHDRATLISRSTGGAFPVMFDLEGDTVLPVITSVFTTSGGGTVIITVP
jgi:hypothetical protein